MAVSELVLDVQLDKLRQTKMTTGTAGKRMTTRTQDNISASGSG
jgi:hypothetical protein